MKLTELPPPDFDPGFDSVSTGPPDSFVAFFVLALLVGLGVTVYKVSTARSIATRAGMDPDDATKMTLLSDDGFEATYLAANLRGRDQTPSVAAGPAGNDRGAAARAHRAARAGAHHRRGVRRPACRHHRLALSGPPQRYSSTPAPLCSSIPCAAM